MHRLRSILVLWTLLLPCLGHGSEKGTELNVQVGEEIRHLDPQRSTGISSAHIAINLFTGLFEYHHQTGAPVASLAKRFESNADHTEWIFDLRDDFYWVQNKQGNITKQMPLTAEDVVFSFQRILDPKLASEYAYMLYVLKNAQAFNEGKITDPNQVGVVALDKYRIKLQLEGPVPTLINYLPHHSFHIVPKAQVLRHGEDWIKEEHVWTSGPFAFEKWHLKDKITIVKNPFFAEAKDVQVDRINFKFIGTYSPEAVRAFRAGFIDIDMQSPPANELVSLKRSGHLQIAAQLGTYFYRMNTTIKPLDDPRVRRALALTVPRKQITKYIMKGGQQPTFGFIPRSFAGYTGVSFVDESAIDQNEFNKEAKQLMAQAGFLDGRDFPSFSIGYNTSETHKKIAVIIAKSWQKVLGIRVRPLNEEWRVYLENQKNLGFEIQRGGWVADMDDPINFAELFVTNGGNNNTGYSNPTFDQLISAARIEGNASKRMALIQQSESILMQDLPIIPIFNYVSIGLVQKNVSGFYANKFDQHPLRFVRKL